MGKACSTQPGNALRCLRILAEKPATQLVDRPLKNLLPLIDDGYAEISGRWDEVVNGKTWHCERVSITEAGLAFLARLSGETLK